MRRNSTYLMLEVALKFQEAFERLENDDMQYVNNFQEYGGCRRSEHPTTFDWENASILVKFFKCFHEVTLKFSISMYVSSNVYFHGVRSLVTELERLSSMVIFFWVK